jgi:hypothetical protein
MFRQARFGRCWQHWPSPVPSNERRILAGDILDRLQQRLMGILQRAVMLAHRGRNKSCSESCAKADGK